MKSIKTQYFLRKNWNNLFKSISINSSCLVSFKMIQKGSFACNCNQFISMMHSLFIGTNKKLKIHWLNIAHYINISFRDWFLFENNFVLVYWYFFNYRSSSMWIHFFGYNKSKIIENFLKIFEKNLAIKKDDSIVYCKKKEEFKHSI